LLILVVAAGVAAIVLIAVALGGSGDTVSVAPQPSDSKREAVVWAVGDGADGGAASVQVGRLIARAKPDRVLYLGDVYEHGTRLDFATDYANAFGSFAKRTAPTPGNHDWPNRVDGYRPYWKQVTGHDVPDYYAFSTAGWRLISLNSEMPHDSGSPQVKWLDSKLKGPGNCRIAFWHRPRYSAGDHHGDQPDVQPFWDELKGHAVLVLNGHEHDMQRFAPKNGITEIVSGAGGHDLYGLDKSHAGLVFGDSSSFGALRIQLTRGSAKYKFVSADGRTLDSGSTSCKPA
jgi:hypothetical protein